MKPPPVEKSTKIFTVEIPSTLHYRWKMTALKRKVSMAQMIADAMLAYLAKPTGTHRTKYEHHEEIG